jgi:hypothetical protein
MDFEKASIIADSIEGKFAHQKGFVGAIQELAVGYAGMVAPELPSNQKELKDKNIVNMSKNPISQKDELILDLSNDNEVLEANEETNETDTEPVNTGGGTEWVAFMGHIPHTEFDYLKSEMEKFDAPYIMSAEAGKYEHFHFLAKITPRQYHNFACKNFMKKYKLKGRAHKGIPRQYGKVKEIKDISKMMTYTMKDKNYTTNMTTEQIETIIKMKIDDVENTKNEMNIEIKEKMINYVNEKINNYITNKKYIDSRKIIRMAIIDFMIERKATIIRTTIERYYFYYIAHTNNDVFKENSKSIYDELYEI